jgi:long-chain fatty acid transport protein
MLRLAIVTAVLAVSSWARAGGLELQEQSAAGLSMAGAQAAKADDPAAVYYNPAGLTFQRGLGVLTGGNIIHSDSDVTPAGGTSSFRSSATAFAPNVFVAQRLGPHFAIGVGLFANFAQHFDYPKDYPGRFIGNYFDLKAVTINPTVAIRPVPWISVGFGLDIVPSSLVLHRALNFGSEEGTIEIAADAVGVGGNVGVMAILVPRWLTLGVSYRSLVELDFTGPAAINAPAPLMANGIKNAATTFVLPHNFSFALSTRPATGLCITAEAHLTLWHDLGVVTLQVSDPAAPPGTAPLRDKLVLNWNDSVGVRVGGEYVLLDGRLPLRLGVGYDMTPTPSNTMTPLALDADRILVSGGFGWRAGDLSADVGYLAAILLDRVGTNPDFPASYHSIGHVVAINLSLRLQDFGGRINIPEFKH